ncbi:MAG: acyl-CoA synthetase, partial [Mycobacterium sp.]|nr:acyl-CoA synthetase [Mycobacterium sp.]
MTADDRLNLARIPASLREHYLRTGLWNDTSLGDLLLEGLRRRPGQRVGIWSKRTGRSETFGSLEATARRVAAGLSQRGVVQGDRVVIWLPNGWEAAATFVAVAAL